MDYTTLVHQLSHEYTLLMLMIKIILLLRMHEKHVKNLLKINVITILLNLTIMAQSRLLIR